MATPNRTKKRRELHGCSPDGMTPHPLYRVWESMMQRCYNQNHYLYQSYGGRGISVCARWRNSFLVFLNDVGERPDGCSIERSNNNGNYEPSNVRWATPKEQARNRRNTKFTMEKARAMRALYAAGESQSTIAKKFDTTQAVVSDITLNKRWKE